MVILFLTMSLIAETQAAGADKKEVSVDPTKDANDDSKTPLTLPVVCNPFLLSTFKLNRSVVPDTLPNLVCPGIQKNCCSYSAQHQINRLWAKGSERKTIVDLYRGFVDTYKKIFNQFERIEPMAQTIFNATADQTDSICNLIAKSVMDAKFSLLKNDVIKNAKKAFDFLYSSRKGFYCSLCDKNAHNLYEVDGELIALSFSFCNEMVKETLPHFIFKHIHFMKMARLYGELMAKCTIEGDYRPNEYLNNTAIFLKEPEYINELTTCKNNLAKADAYNYCGKFCERFNPVRFDPLLEGDLSKLASFAKILNDLTDSKVGVVKVSSKDALLNITENAKRILSERNLSERNSNRRRYRRNLADAPAAPPAPPAAPTAPADPAAKPAMPTAATSSLNSKIEINNFNAEYETALIRPVTYNFAYDLNTTLRISFEYSYIQSVYNSKYNISVWRTKLLHKGINYLFYGRSTDMTKATANNVFFAANPNALTGIETKDAVNVDNKDPNAQPATGDAANGQTPEKTADTDAKTVDTEPPKQL